MAILAECPHCHKKQKITHKHCKCGIDLDRQKRAKKVKFWINYVIAGKQRREPVGFSIEEARIAEGKRKAQKYENPRILQKVPEERMTFQELTNWYLNLEKVKDMAYFPRLKVHLAAFNSEFGNRIIGSIKSADIENYQAKRKRADPTKLRKHEGLSDATVDQEVGAAKRVVLKASDNDLVSGETVRVFKRIKRMLKPNSNARTRILTKEEFESLLEHSPFYLKTLLATAFYTGMREGECLQLTWDHIDLSERMISLTAEMTKDREARTIPICAPLYEILRNIPKGLHDPHVFLRDGRPIGDFYKILKKVCGEAGIPYGRFTKNGFIFHDLRHCFNTMMRRSGVDQHTIMTLTGHSTNQMFFRYSTVDQTDVHNAVSQMTAYWENLDQSLDQKGSRSRLGEMA